MRVIAGEFRSRLLKSPAGLDVRPTPDRLRETLFNILAAQIKEAVFVDVYAGTGAVGIEALSRGASRAIFIEHSRTAVRVIRENLSALGLEARAQVRQSRAAAAVLAAMELPIDIVFIDPPYRLEPEYERILAILGENPPPLVVVQHATRFELSGSYGRLNCRRVLKHGDNALSFYER